jgi:serine/threonine-protein kinase
MELLAGTTLRVELERAGQLPSAAAAEWFDQLLDGLEAAHRESVVHRDLKPENIMGSRAASGQLTVKILDYGLAKVVSGDTLVTGTMTAQGVVMGTFGYMAPEQLQGGAIDQRTDLFAVGVMLVEALTGRRPFTGATLAELTRSVMHDTYHLPDGTTGGWKLDALLQRCLAKNRDERIESAEALRRELIPLLTASDRHAAL